MGIDVGGTFTDLVMVRADGTTSVHKVLNNESGAASAVRGATEMADDPGDVAAIVHGTTVATNAVLERTGATTAVVTTRGFRDVLELARQERGDIWDLYWSRPAPLVPRHLRFEVDERLAADGSVLTPLDVATALADLLPELDRTGVEAVAICFLHSFQNPAHERLLLDALHQARPDLHVSASHLVAAQYREYDRMSTTVLNAYLGPIIQRHLAALGGAMEAQGLTADLHVMQSNGGIVPVSAAAALGASLCMSGPAGGVLAAEELGKQLGQQQLLCLDMGGTSTDVALIRDGRAEISHDTSIDGLISILPTFAIETVGAGGGSIIEFDEAGMLHVGPQSARADPGPACYGNGGTQPTVTDAWCAVGVLREERPHSYLDLDASLAVEAGAGFARQAGSEVREAYWQALRITTANMSSALRMVSLEQGHDPREMTLVAYGGAGGLHAALCADELGVPRVLVPREPGVFSAFGMVGADIQRDYVRTFICPLAAGAEEGVDSRLNELIAQASEEFRQFGFEETPSMNATLDLRYVGQAHSVPVAMNGTTVDLAQVGTSFHDLHRRRYGFAEPASDVEIENVRIQARICRPAPPLRTPVGDGTARDSGVVYLGSQQVAIFAQRDDIRPGQQLAGPAVIEEATATTVVPAGWTAATDEAGVLWLTRQ